MIVFHRDGTLPPTGSNYVFVFGSNEKGLHNSGASVIASKLFGAKEGVGVGVSRNSYAIPTKNKNLQTLSLKEIAEHIAVFKQYTLDNPKTKFWVTSVGCGLSEYDLKQVAYMFKGCSPNCSFPEAWVPYVKKVKTYTGIGSRKTPTDVLEWFKELGGMLAGLGYLMRSGAASGADTAFENGCDEVYGDKEVWLPWPRFNQRSYKGYLPTPAHMAIASKHHTAWEYLKDSHKKLHSRNVGQILGEDLHTATDFVICWTEDGAETYDEVTDKTGGTGMAIKMAAINNIPVFNFANEDAYARLIAHIAING